MKTLPALMLSAVVALIGCGDDDKGPTSPADTGDVTIQLTAMIESVHDDTGMLPGAIQPGAAITGTFTYDPEAEDNSPLATVGDYRFRAAPYGIFLEIQGYQFKTELNDVDFLVQVVNNHGTPPRDNYLLRSYNNAPVMTNLAVEHISWQLDNPNADALTSTDLTREPPVLADWTSTFGLSINGYRIDDPSGTFMIRGHVTQIARVP